MSGLFFIDGANGGFIVTGTTSPGAGEWTVVQSNDCSFKTSQTIVDFTDMDLNQFISVSGNPALFPGCFVVSPRTTRTSTTACSWILDLRRRVIPTLRPCECEEPEPGGTPWRLRCRRLRNDLRGDEPHRCGRATSENKALSWVSLKSAPILAEITIQKSAF